VKILLDECVPKRLGRSLSEHDVVTTPQAGWAGKDLLHHVFALQQTLSSSLTHQVHHIGTLRLVRQSRRD
jgi:hypothetical protein